MKVLKKSEVMPGDVIVFKIGAKDWLGEIIGFLTNSRVSHAGMIYPIDTGNDSVTDNRIIDVGDEGIRTYNFYDFPREEKETNTVYILRHPEYKALNPVIQNARMYLNSELKYDMPGLFLLAGLLVYRKLPITSEWYPFVGKILKKVCMIIDNWIQQNRSESAMICSQFVYQCYHMTEEKYRIVIANGNLDFNEATAGARLIDVCQNLDMNSIPHSEDSLSQQDAEEMDEMFFKQMLNVLSTRSLETTDPLLSLPTPNIVEFVHRFNKQMEHFATELHLPLESMFVTPADLFEHAENLSLQGTMYLKWH